MLYVTEKYLYNIHKENSLNAIALKLELIYSTVSLKVAIAQVYIVLQVYHFNILRVTLK